MEPITIEGVARETWARAKDHLPAFATLTAAFAFLPALAFQLALPETAVDMRAALAAGRTGLPGWFWPAALAVFALQSVATFAIVAVAGDPARPPAETVGRTLARVAPGVPRYVAAVLLLAVAYIVALLPLALVLGVAFGVAAAGGAKVAPGPVAVVTVLLILPALLWVGARLSPMVGVFAIERAGPIAGLRRAWRLTAGQGRRLLLLLVVTGAAALAASLLVAALAGAFGSVAKLAGGDAFGRLVEALVGGAVNGGIFILFATGLGVIYRRLRASGPGR